MIKYSHNGINLLSVLQYKGIGAAWVVSNWRTDITDEQIVELINQSVKGQNTSEKEFDTIRKNVLHIIEQQDAYMDGMVGWLDNDYPFCRGSVKRGDFPIILFYKGDIHLLDNAHHNIAVIGVLTPDGCVVEREKKMVSALLRQNYVIVSGLAHGCDSIAHVQALDEDGKTIAILPSTLKNIIPSQHRQLAQRIVEKGGLLVTEYIEEPSSQLEMRGRYQRRDRLQALFSDAIILTASYDINTEGKDCGSRLAMEYARQYQIPRYVMLDEKSDNANPQFALNRRLLREGNACVLTQNRIATLAQQQGAQLGLF